MELEIKNGRILFSHLADFHDWRREEVIKMLLSLPESDGTKHLEGSFSSLNKLVQHVTFAEKVWLERMRPDTFELGSPSFESLSEACKCWNETSTCFTTWVQSLPESMWKEIIQFEFKDQKKMEMSIAQICLHVFDHATFHIGQLTTAVRALGHTPVSTNYIHFLRSNN